MVCAVTFTGAKQPEARPLTGDELAYFNEEFFNNDVSGTNIRNQFLVSLYERPEDIDLYELFYCGIPNSSTFDASPVPVPKKTPWSMAVNCRTAHGTRPRPPIWTLC